jgi:hypothetical protein
VPVTTNKVSASLRRLLTGVVDYAGLFPPARLPLGEAVDNYLRYREEPMAWMLGCFVAPLEQLREMADLDAVKRSGHPIEVSILGRPGDRPAPWIDGLKSDFDEIGRIREIYPDRILPVSMEVRGPRPDNAEEARAAIRDASEASRLAETFSGRSPVLFLEIDPLGDQPSLLLPAIAGEGGGLIGAKIRTGGLSADAFPTEMETAAFIRACHRSGVAFKATAGLHHPLRQFRPEVQCKMHGFLNVFIAGALAHAHGLGEETLARVLQAQDISEFGFGEEGLAWRNLSLLDTDLEAGRSFATSFGSCSFDEPIDDLKAINLL